MAREAPAEWGAALLGGGGLPRRAGGACAGESFREESLDRDLDLAAFDFDLERLQLDSVIEFVLPGPHVVLPAVPWTAQRLSLEPAVAERSLQVEAVLLRGEKLAVDVRDRKLLFVDLDGLDRSRRDVLDAGDVSKLGWSHLSERNKRVKSALG